MLITGTRLGPYEITSHVGAGGMGEVYRARDTRLGRDVAIKILPSEFGEDPQLKLRFEREAQTISQLNHPHICMLYDIGEEQVETDAMEREGADPRLASRSSLLVSYIVMEYLEGESLADRLGRGPLPLAQALRAAIEIAAALERAHRQGIVHRDLKPGNIMLTKSGAKLLDFGLAKYADRSPLHLVAPPSAAGEGLTNSPTAFKPLTTEGTIVGTFQYMAPEQIEGDPADARTDIFALGCVLYEMVTGQRAFQGKTRTSLIASIVSGQPQPITAVQPASPPALERVIQGCLEKDPEDRWQSAHDIRRELEWIRDSVSSGTMAIPESAAPLRRKARERFAWSLAILLSLAAAAAVWLAMRTKPESARPLVSAIAPPRGAEFVVTGDSGGPVTISPDGRNVTFVAKDEEGPRLWVQSLETGSVRSLPGTIGAMFPSGARTATRSDFSARANSISSTSAARGRG